MSVSRIRWIHTSAVIVCAVVLQISIFDQLQPFGLIRVNLPLILIVGVGFVANPADAALIGFVTGIAADTMQFGPFGLSALVFCVAAWLIVLARLRMMQAGATFRTVQGAVIVMAVTMALWFAAGIFGQRPISLDLGTATRLLATGVVGAVLVHPLTSVAQRMVERLDRESVMAGSL